MLSVVTSHSPIKHNSLTIEDQCYQWKNVNTQAHQAYQLKNYPLAAKYFAHSVEISKELKEYFFTDNSGIGMLYSSSHNLSACLNANKKSLEAKHVLLDLYEYLIEVITNRFKKNKIRIEALSYLDKSLFSLSSQLGYINEVENIHMLIRQTEKVATEAEKILMGSSTKGEI